VGLWFELFYALTENFELFCAFNLILRTYVDRVIGPFWNRMLRTGNHGRKGTRGNNSPCAEPLGAPKSHNNVASTFFNTVHLLPKNRFEHGGAKLFSCPGRDLASVRPSLPSPRGFGWLNPSNEALSSPTWNMKHVSGIFVNF